MIRIDFLDRQGGRLSMETVFDDDTILNVPHGTDSVRVVTIERPDGYVGRHRAGAKRPALDQGAAAR